jgi:hypothetical protein
MRSTIDSPAVFFRKMKKKPALQAILDNLDKYSEEELACISGQPLWIRECLVQLKRNSGQYALTRDEIADKMTQEPVLETELTGEVLEWVKDFGWIGWGKDGSRFVTELKAGDLLFLVSDTECYTGDIRITLSPEYRKDLANGAISKGSMTRDAYRELYKAALAKKLV